MENNDYLDNCRWQIQQVLMQAEYKRLWDESKKQGEYGRSQLSPEEELKWLEEIDQFDQQLESGRQITVRQRIGDPIVTPVAQIPLYALAQAVNNLLNLLAEHGIIIDFMGEWDDFAAYQFVTEEILDEEMDDVHIEGMWTHFEATTPECEIEFWVDNFVSDLFRHEGEYFLSGLDKQPLFNMQGEPLTAVQFKQQIEAVWKVLPATPHAIVALMAVEVEAEEGTMTAKISWHNDDENSIGQVESYFRLQLSPYSGWDIVQTSLLDDLLLFLGRS